MSNIDTGKDLAFVLRLTHSQTLVSPSDIVTASSERINSRYARELLGLGATHNLLVVEDDPELGDVWMLNDAPASDLTDASDNPQVDYHATSESMAFDALSIDAPKTGKIKKTEPVKVKSVLDKDGKPRLCTCGCGENLQGKSMYRPGHDARHAGWVARYIAAQPTDEHEFDALNALPTQALRDKATAHANRIIEKNAKKGKVQEQPVFTPRRGTIKMGRWTYDVETTPEGQIVAYKKNGDLHSTRIDGDLVAWS